MNNIIRIVALIGILAISQVAYSNDERDANTAGVATNAENISINGSGISANADDIADLGSGAGGTPDFSGYGTPFSADGVTKNVIVAKRLNNDGSGNYSARIFYTNTLAEQIMIGGGLITPPFIGKFVFANFDATGA